MRDEDQGIGFWIGGADRCAQELTRLYEPQIDRLRNRIAAADSGERETLNAKIALLTLEYRSKMQEIDQKLF